VTDPFAYLVAYDVTDDACRSQVAELLLDMGGTRLQKSLFSVRLDEAGLVRMQSRAEPLIVESHDKLGWWRTCGNCPGVLARTQSARLPPGPTGSDAWIV
jgi:CRISPR-associated endonuclease Cas2